MARVLVVDDERDVSDLVVRCLRAERHEVVVARDADSALAAVGRYGRPDAAVLDVDLPGMDGIALLRVLRADHPGLPAVFLTVLWSAADIDRMRAADGRYVAKPFTADALRAAVRDLLPDGGAVG